MQVYSQYLWNTVFSKGKIWVFAGARGQMNTTLCQNRPEKTQNWTNLYLKPHDCQIYYANINLRHQYGISAAESQTFLRAKRPQRRRARRNGCFRRLLFLIFAIFLAQSFHVARKILVTFAIFAKFAISSILFWVFFKCFLLKLRKQFASKVLPSRSILDISDVKGNLFVFVLAAPACSKRSVGEDRI